MHRGVAMELNISAEEKDTSPTGKVRGHQFHMAHECGDRLQEAQ